MQALLGQIRGRVLGVSLAGTTLAFGCTGSDSSDTGLTLDPPTLAFTGATAGDGVAYDADVSSIALDCSAPLTVHLGPRDGAGELENFRIRPPKWCGESDPCGYVKLEVRGKGDAPLLTIESALLDIALEPSTLPEPIVSLHAVLMGNQTLEPYQVDGKPVVADWALDVTTSACSAAGGAGGQGGAGGAGFGGAGGAP